MMRLCANCQSRTQFKRNVGGLSWLFLVISLLCALAVPIFLIAWVLSTAAIVLMHPRRCIRCGETAFLSSTTQTVEAIREDPKNTLIGVAAVAGAVLLGVFVCYLLGIN